MLQIHINPLNNFIKHFIKTAILADGGFLNINNVYFMSIYNASIKFERLGIYAFFMDIFLFFLPVPVRKHFNVLVLLAESFNYIIVQELLICFVPNYSKCFLGSVQNMTYDK